MSGAIELLILHQDAYYACDWKKLVSDAETTEDAISLEDSDTKWPLARKNIPAAVAMIEEVDGLSDEINVVGVLPVVSADMGILHATYQFKSLKDWGEKVDEIGMSDTFQAIVTKANELGTLESSMGYMSI